MTTNIFRQDNTRGYLDSELATLNKQWGELELDYDTDEGKAAAERLLHDFDFRGEREYDAGMHN